MRTRPPEVRESRIRHGWAAARDGRRAAFVGTFCAFVFAFVNCRNYANDVVPLALVPVSIWREGNVSLDEYRGYRDTLAAPYCFVESGGHLYPMKPLAISLLATPFYALPVLLGVPSDRVEFWIAWSQLVASGFTGVGLGLGFLTIRRWLTAREALVFTILLAFGTCVWTTVGQNLSYHTGGFLCVAVITFLLVDLPLRPGSAGLVGLCAGAAVAMRPTCAVLLFPLGLYLILPGRLDGWKSRLAAAAGLGVVLSLLAFQNALLFGQWSSTGYSPEEVDRWTTPLCEGAFGLLAAPNSGLLVQSPFAVLALLGGWAAFRTPRLPGRGLLCAYAMCFVAYWLLFARWHDWQGGLTFSSRMLAEGYPLWLPLVAVGWRSIRHLRYATPFLAVAGAWSILYQVIGVATFDAVSIFNPPHRPWGLFDHTFMRHLAWFGGWNTTGTVALTVAKLTGCSMLVFTVLTMFFLPRRVGTG